MSNRNRTPRTAALFLSIAVGGASLALVPAANAADAPVTSVVRLSLAKAHAGDVVLVKGTKLATYDDGTSKWTAKTVKFGDKTVDASDVKALSETTLKVEVPTTAAGSVAVTVGDAVKGPKFAYVATVTTDQDDLDAITPTSEGGLTGQTVVGDHITKATKVLVGGKSVKFAKDAGAAADGTKFTFDYPAGLTGEQDVVVVDNGETDYLGYVTYKAAKPTVSAVSTDEVSVEAPTAVTLTGTNLDAVISATYNGTEKVTVAKATDSGTKMVVTVPKGAAVADKNLVLTTKYGETATYSLDRVAAKAPTVTGVTGAKAAGGEVTLTGTNLVGLKAVKVYSTTATVKTYSGSKITVVSPTSAKVTLPVLPDNAAYKIEVTTYFATPSAKFDFEVGTVAAPTPAPVLTDASYTFAADDVVNGGKASIDLEGTNLVVGQKVRYYTDAQGTAGAIVTTLTTVGSGGTVGSVVLTATDLADDTYHVQISKDGGTTWETAVVDCVVLAA